MSMRITFDLSDKDLAHFRKVMKKGQARARDADEAEITAPARRLLEDMRGTKLPEFIARRLQRLETLINMVHDELWALPASEKKRVLSALAYFSDPMDLIPDEIPGLGYLDDAIMVEIVLRELKHEIEAYEDFCRYRDLEGKRRGASAQDLSRASWVIERRKHLHKRMRDRRSRSNLSSPGRRTPFSLF